jgi:hypothetical protein
MTQSTVSDRIGLVVSPDSVQLAPGSKITIVLTVTNTGPVVDQFGLVVDGLDSSWYDVREGLLNLYPGAVGRLEVDIHLPDGPDAVAGLHTATFRVLSREAPSASTSFDVPIEILSIGGLEASISPRRVTLGLRGAAAYVLTLTNTGNADTLVDLAVRDPEQALNVEVRPDRVSVPHGGTAQVNVVARPLKRPIVSSERAYVFSIDVTRTPEADAPVDQASETVAIVIGELAYRPPLATLAALPLSARRLAMALAAAALVAALLIWFLAAPGRRGALIERVPAAKPVVAAVESALKLPEPVAAATTGADAAATGTPQIKKFELSTPGQDGATDYALVWEVDGADQVTIQGQPQPNASAGRLHLDQLDSTEYVLQATKGATTVNRSVGIVILRPPDIQQLTASPQEIAPGESATLQWKAVRGERASLADQSVDPTGGALKVSPSRTTLYTLVVDNELGQAQRTVEVRVAPDAAAAAKP